MKCQQNLTTVTEYIHVFAKNINEVNFSRLENEEDPVADWEQDELGYYKEGYGLIKTGSGARREDRPNLYFPIYVGANNSIRTCLKSHLIRFRIK